MLYILLLKAQLSSMAMTGGQPSMLHLQSNMQHSPLGISIINTHSGTVSLRTPHGRLGHYILYDTYVAALCALKHLFFLPHRCLRSP